MGVLSRGALVVAAAALTSCYEPALRDCTVTCSASSECAGDQVCGEDGLCASPGAAGKCAAVGSGGVDAGVRPVDAAPPDAALTIALHVQINGKGSVVVDNRGVCTTQGDQRGDCTFAIPIGAAQTVRALPVLLGESFKNWMSPTCKDASAVCTFTPSAAPAEIMLVARFGK